MNIASLFASSGALLGLLVASALLFTCGPKARANRILAVTLVICSAYLASLIPLHSPQLSSLSFLKLGSASVFLFGPALYLYVCAMTDNDFRLRNIHGLHALPYVLIVLDGLGLFSPVAGQSGSILAAMPKVVGIIYYISLLAYLAACTARLARFKAQLQNSHSSVEGINLQWLATLVITCLILCVPGLVFAIVRLWDGLIDWPQQLYSISLMMSISYLIAFNAITRPGIFNALQTTPQAAEAPEPQYKTSTLTPSQADDIWQLVQRAMASDKLYLLNQLKIGDVAKAMDIPANHLSQTINQKGGCSFFDYINGYRVEAAKRELGSIGGRNSTMLDVAMASGFNSESVFYKRFKAHTGMTPRQFQRKNSAKLAEN